MAGRCRIGRPGSGNRANAPPGSTAAAFRKQATTRVSGRCIPVTELLRMPSPALVPLRRRRESSAPAAPKPVPKPLEWRGGDFLLHGGSLPLDEGQRLQRYRGLSVSVVAQVVMVALVLAGLAIGPRPIRLKPDPPEQQVLTWLVAPPPPVHYRVRPPVRRERLRPPRALVTPRPPVIGVPPRRRAGAAVKLPPAPAVKMSERAPVLAAATPPPPPPPPPATVKLGRFGASRGIVATTGQPVA